MAAATEKLAQRLREGQALRIGVGAVGRHPRHPHGHGCDLRRKQCRRSCDRRDVADAGYGAVAANRGLFRAPTRRATRCRWASRHQGAPIQPASRPVRCHCHADGHAGRGVLDVRRVARARGSGTDWGHQLRGLSRRCAGLGLEAGIGSHAPASFAQSCRHSRRGCLKLRPASTPQRLCWWHSVQSRTSASDWLLSFVGAQPAPASDPEETSAGLISLPQSRRSNPLTWSTPQLARLAEECGSQPVCLRRPGRRLKREIWPRPIHMSKAAASPNEGSRH